MYYPPLELQQSVEKPKPQSYAILIRLFNQENKEEKAKVLTSIWIFKLNVGWLRSLSTLKKFAWKSTTGISYNYCHRVGVF